VSKRLSLGLSILFFVVYLYLVLRESLLPVIAMPGVSGGLRIGTLTLMLFSLCHAGYLLGWRLAVAFFAISAAVSWLFEQAGVDTGLIYGAYHYSDMLGAKLGHVPVLIPLAWFMMIYPSYVIANLITSGQPVSKPSGIGAVAGLSFLSAMIMTAWDLAMDPGMSAAGHWIWEQGGPYFGVPLQNFAGWLLTTFVVYLLYRLWERKRLPQDPGTENVIAAAMPVAAYAVMALYYALRGQPEGVQVIAFFAMGLPVILAVARLFSMKTRHQPWPARPA